MSHEKEEEMFNRLVKERALEIADIKDRIDCNNLVYTFKAGVNEPKDFGNYQMSVGIFEDLRNGNINPKKC